MTAWNSRFVEKYSELQKLGETDEEKLFVETGKALLAEGVLLRRVGEARTVSILLLKLLLGVIAYSLEVKGRLGFPSPTLAYVSLNTRSDTGRLNIPKFRKMDTYTHIRTLKFCDYDCYLEQVSCC